MKLLYEVGHVLEKQGKSKMLDVGGARGQIADVVSRFGRDRSC